MLGLKLIHVSKRGPGCQSQEKGLGKIYICASVNCAIISSDDSMSQVKRQAWSHVDIL